MRQKKKADDKDSEVTLQRLRNINYNFKVDYGLDDEEDDEEDPFNDVDSSDEFVPSAESSDTDEDEEIPINTEELSDE